MAYVGPLKMPKDLKKRLPKTQWNVILRCRLSVLPFWSQTPSSPIFLGSHGQIHPQTCAGYIIPQKS